MNLEHDFSEDAELHIRKVGRCIVHLLTKFGKDDEYQIRCGLVGFAVTNSDLTQDPIDCPRCLILINKFKEVK
jgi:hypothetical protein